MIVPQQRELFAQGIPPVPEVRDPSALQELAAESKLANSALYRSQIARVGQSLDNGDLAGARQTLEDIARTESRSSQRGLEYSLLMARAYPEAARLDANLPVTAAAAWFADGGGFVTLGADGALRTWTADARPVNRSGAHEQTTLLAVSPTSDTIATADARGVVRLWQKERLAPLASVDTARTDPRSLTWHPDGRTLWMTDGGGALLCIDADSTEVRDVPLAVAGFSDTGFSADGRWLVAVSQLRRLAVFSLPRIHEVLDEQLNGRAVLSTGDRLVARAEPLAAFDMPGLVSAVAWSANAPRFAAADDSGTVGVWAVEPVSANEPTTVREIWKTSAEGGLAALAWSQGELLLADGRGWLTALDSQRLRTAWRQPAGPIRQIVASPASDKWLVVKHGDGGVSVWDRDRLTVGRPIVQGDVPIRSVALSPTGRHAAWRDIDGRITVFDMLDQSPIANLDEPALGATAIAWNPNSDLLAIGRSGGVILFDPQAGATRQRLTIHQGTVWALAFSPDGKLLVSGAEDGTAMITDLSTGKSHALAGHQGEVRAVAFSHDGKIVATADAAATVRLFDLAGRPGVRREINAPSINALAFLPDSSLAIAQGNGRVSIIDATSGELRKTWQAHGGAVWSLAAAGDQIFSSGQDGVIALWDTEGNLELTLAPLRSPVWALAWSAQAERLLACTTAGAVHEWTSR
jgi:WD40 repeat protein